MFTSLSGENLELVGFLELLEFFPNIGGIFGLKFRLV